MSPRPVEVAWFGALCDDDYEFLGVPEDHRVSSWTHCSDIVRAADRNGFDNVLLPSGYDLGIDSTAFAAAIATHTDNIHLLLAVRIGEMWLPQLARQLASIDQFANGRLTINIISSDMPGETLASGPRYQRTREWMRGLRSLLSGEALEMQGDFIDLSVTPPRAATLNGQCPPLYFGGFSEDAKDVAASEADVFLTWPDTVASVSSTVEEMQNRAAAYDRELICGLRTHVIVRETEGEARAAADRLISRHD
ncbi:MAG: LLM class flavin-dependent oxidoreductase, partial [Ilumatobacteraceae bacterium]